MVDQSKLRFKNIKNVKIEQYINKNTQCDLDIDQLKQMNKFYEDKKKLMIHNRIFFSFNIYFRFFLIFLGLAIFLTGWFAFPKIEWATFIIGLVIMGISLILYWVPTIPMCDVKRAIDLIKEWRDNDILIKEIDTYPLPLKALFDTSSVSYKGYFTNRLLKQMPLIDKTSYEDNCAVYRNSNVRTPNYRPGSEHSMLGMARQSRFNVTRYQGQTIPYCLFNFIYEFTKYQLKLKDMK